MAVTREEAVARLNALPPEQRAQVRQAVGVAPTEAQVSGIPQPGVQSTGGTVGGVPFRSEAEKADIEKIQSTEGDGTFNFLRAAASPSNVLGAAGFAAGGAVGKTPGAALMGERAGVALGSGIESLAAGEGPGEALTNLGINLGANEAGRLGLEKVVGPMASAASRKIAAALPGSAKNLHEAVSRKVIGKVSPEMADSFEFINEAVGVIEGEVNNIRGGVGAPLLHREDILNTIGDELGRMKSEGFFTAAQLTDSSLLDQLEGFGRGSGLTGGKFKRQDEARNAVLKAYQRVYLRLLGPAAESGDAVGKIAAEAAENLFDRRGEQTSAIFNEIEDRVGDWAVRIDPDFMNGLVGQFDKLDKDMAGGLVDGEGVGRALREARKIQETFTASGARSLNYSQAKALRSALRDISAGVPEGQDVTKAIYTQLNGTVKDAQREVLQRYDAAHGLAGRGKRSTEGLFDAVNTSFEKEMVAKETIELREIVELAGKFKRGSEVMPKILPLDSDVGRIKFVRSRLGGEKSEAWQTVKRWHTEALINRSPTFESMLSDLTEQTGKVVGPAKWKAILGSDEAYRGLLRWTRSAIAANKKNPAGTKIAPHIMETGMAISMPAAAVDPGGRGVRALPGAVAYIVATSRLGRWLTDPDVVMALARQNSGQQLTKKEFGALSRAVSRTFAEQTIDGTRELVEAPRQATTLQDLRDKKSNAVK